MEIQITCPKCGKLLLNLARGGDTGLVILKAPEEGLTLRLGDLSGLRGHVVCACATEVPLDLSTAI